MRTQTITLLGSACCLGLALAMPADADPVSPQLQYDAETGEVQIINPDPPVAQVVIVGGPFNTNQFNQPASSSVLLWNATNLSILFLNPQPQGPVSFGPILDAGLSEQAFNDRITAASSQGQAMDLVYVPEPTSMALLSLGGLALMRRRRAGRVV